MLLPVRECGGEGEKRLVFVATSGVNIEPEDCLSRLPFSPKKGEREIGDCCSSSTDIVNPENMELSSSIISMGGNKGKSDEALSIPLIFK